MLKFIVLLLSFLATGLPLTAQYKTRPAQRKASTGKQGAGLREHRLQASPGKELTFSDVLLLSGTPQNTEAILLQKGFKITKQVQPDAYDHIDTFLYRNAAGEQLYFFQPGYSSGFLTEIVFNTPSQTRARQMLAAALKNGFSPVDSVPHVTGNSEESFRVPNVKYGAAPAKTLAPYYDTYQTFFAATQTYTPTKLYSFYFFRELQREPAVVEPGKPPATTEEAGPSLAKSATTDVVAGRPDTLVIGAGKPVLLFTDMGLSGTSYSEGQDEDSVAFFRKRDFFYGSYHRFKAAYPPGQFRYINLYKPVVVRFENSKKESLFYFPGKVYSEFVYWSGEARDSLHKHPGWQDAEYIVRNARGDNKLSRDYKNFLADSLTVARVSALPTGRPSGEVLQGMNQLISALVWKDAFLYFPQLDLKQVRSITASGNDRSVQYYFNRNGQLDSIANRKGTRKAEASSYTVRWVQYKDNLPYAAYDRYDTVYFKYAGDTVITQENGRLQRYRLDNNSLYTIDKFETRPDKYLRNNISDYINYDDAVSLEPSSETDTDGAALIRGESDYRDIKSRYIFKKGALQQIQVTGRNIDIRYFVFVEKYQ